MLLSGGKDNKTVCVRLNSYGVFMCMQENAWKEINQISTVAIFDTEIMADF